MKKIAAFATENRDKIKIAVNLAAAGTTIIMLACLIADYVDETKDQPESSSETTI